MLELVHTEDLRKGLEVAKIPGQKAAHNDVDRDSRRQIMREIEKAQRADHCTEAAKDKRK
jgi:hypothetical protein